MTHSGNKAGQEHQGERIFSSSSKINIMEDERHERERWIRFRAPSLPEGVGIALRAVGIQIPGHRWTQVRILPSRGRRHSSDNPHAFSAGRSVNVTLVLAYTNDRHPKITDVQLEHIITELTKEL